MRLIIKKRPVSQAALLMPFISACNGGNRKSQRIHAKPERKKVEQIVFLLPLPILPLWRWEELLISNKQSCIWIDSESGLVTIVNRWFLIRKE